ncbi:MAG: hypothetical protein ABI295_01305 [Xanthomarina sp.]
MKKENHQHQNLKSIRLVKTSLKTFFGTALVVVLALTSCSSNDDVDNTPTININRPAAQDFSNIRNQALDNITQNFQFNADNGNISLTSIKGVDITLNANCLTKNGHPVSGMVDLKYVEIFEKGNMLTSHKPTMGLRPNGNIALIITGGEFFFEATQNGEVLESSCAIRISVPAALTGGPDPDMILWDGVIDANGDLTWEPDEPGSIDGIYIDAANYHAFIQNFGWTNIDRFYQDPRPKTNVYVQAPIGFNYTNSAIYLSYNGQEFGLASLYTFTNGLFSMNSAEIPIGLECHVVFVSEQNGAWRYAIKPITVTEDNLTTFSMAETNVTSEADLISIINGLP